MENKITKEVEVDITEELSEAVKDAVALFKKRLGELSLQRCVVNSDNNANGSITIKYKPVVGGGENSITVSKDLCGEIIRNSKNEIKRLVLEDVPHYAQERLLKVLL